jgi:uncharacterized protein YbcI
VPVRRILKVVMTLTRESLELEIANAIGRYHREQQGKAPGRIHATLRGNLIVIHSEEIFTPTEAQLLTDKDGRNAVKSARRECRSLTREMAHALISGVVGCPVLRSFWDLDVRVGEQMEGYVLSEDVESRFIT